MWNNTDLPLAYLTTFRCYGTWVHGDERGSVDRFHNQYQAPYIPHNERWRQHNAQALIREPVLLYAAQRESVEAAVRETCALRNWRMHATNVRTNHVHVVVAIGAARSKHALNAFKANAKMDSGANSTVLGRTRVASGIFGTCEVSNGPLIMSSTAKAIGCRCLTEEIVVRTAADPPATAGRTGRTGGCWRRLASSVTAEIGGKRRAHNGAGSNFEGLRVFSLYCKIVS
jgi:hypothetical protein